MKLCFIWMVLFYLFIDAYSYTRFRRDAELEEGKKVTCYKCKASNETCSETCHGIACYVLSRTHNSITSRRSGCLFEKVNDEDIKKYEIMCNTDYCNKQIREPSRSASPNSESPNSASPNSESANSESANNVSPNSASKVSSNEGKLFNSLVLVATYLSNVFVQRM